ncbi:esterase/lipase family protein [Actinomadura algeriensis]|uniref:Triacylglycerol esterase/lipase EstA (Alpha/beta hydrolase family) n=1 Tax=Actinomadura algeriensis TaxID=1679523 RepID=A0ABR9JR38_9ACTN|nr:alpha/beta fold hydrolase [Actinomadura algeriensis]MBE1532848.1 triacylglycerol esterase/lipase EstA (alpha/beta hydrolase family) [Actinomadura algeriensis]
MSVMRRRFRRGLAAAATAACTALSVGATAPAAAARTPYPVGDLTTAIGNFVLSPDAVAGANDWTCEPSAEHPEPVVIVHGTTSNFGFAGAMLAPTLANAGYCVYGFNYGETQASLGRIYGLGDVAESARTMSAFVDRVLAATGAAEVDVVGGSQGGMMPNYYIKRLGGAAKVRTLVGLAPTNHGTTMGGLVDLGRKLGVLGLVNDFLRLIGSPAHVQQEEGSEFQEALFADGDTVPGVRYVTIATAHDTTVTPLTNSFLHGGDSTNILLQDLCPDDPVGHSGTWFDGPIMQIVLNALGPDEPGFRPECTGYGPSI